MVAIVLKGESFGPGKPWVLAKSKRRDCDRLLKIGCPGSVCLVVTEGNSSWMLLSKDRYARLKCSQFQNLDFLGAVSQKDAVRVAAKLCARGEVVQGTLRLVFDESLTEHPVISSLMALSDDEFNKQAAEIQLDAGKKDIAKLLPRIKKLRQERAKKAVDIQQAGEDAAKKLEPFHKLSEKQFQQYILAVKAKAPELRTEEEKEVLRVQGPLVKLRRDQMLKSSCGVVHETGSVKFKVADFYADKLEAWSYRRDVGVRVHQNALGIIGSCLDKGVTLVFHGGHGTGKTSLAMALADSYAKSRAHEQWFMARSFEGVKEASSYLVKGSAIVLDEAKISGTKDHNKMMMSSESGQMEARYRDLVLPSEVRRIFTVQTLQRLGDSFGAFDDGVPEQRAVAELSEDDLAILKRVVVVRVAGTLYDAVVADDPLGHDEAEVPDWMF